MQFFDVGSKLNQLAQNNKYLTMENKRFPANQKDYVCEGLFLQEKFFVKKPSPLFRELSFVSRFAVTILNKIENRILGLPWQIDKARHETDTLFWLSYSYFGVIKAI